MTVTASGMLSLPLHNLRVLVAASSTFQTWVSATSGTNEQKAAAALARVYRTAKSEDEITRPFAMVWESDDWSWDSHASSSVGSDSGALELAFEALVPDAHLDNDADAETDFNNSVGAILSEMGSLANSSNGGYLIVRRIRKVFGPVRSKISEQHDCLFRVFGVDYGIGD